MHRSAVAGLIAAVVGTVALLALAVEFGLLTPPARQLPAVAHGRLDYAVAAPPLAPLTEAFIETRLGPGPASPSLVPRATASDRDTGIDGGQPSGPQVPTQTVVVHRPTNDDRSAAYVVRSIPFTATTDPSAADREPDEPDDCAPTGRTLWYRYTPDRDEGLLASSIGSDAVVTLGVFEVRGSGLLPLRCDSHPLGNAQVAFPGEAGQSYLFQLAVTGESDTLVFNLDPLGSTSRLADGAGGEPPNGVQFGAALSADGRYVAFSSHADNLVPGDTNGHSDVFVLDRTTRVVERVSVATDGTQADDDSGILPAISADGRFVAFHSRASTLVPDDENGWMDVFVHDRLLDRTTRVSVTSDGREGQVPVDPHAATVAGSCEAENETRSSPCQTIYGVSISGGGRYVAFESTLDGLVPDDTPLAGSVSGVDVFVHDRSTGETTMVSRATDGTPGDDWSDFPAISDDGRFVAFRSRANNLDGGGEDTFDVFVHDRASGTTELVSRAVDGGPADADSGAPRISADGRWIAFDSTASDLVEGDTNGLVDAFLHDRSTGDTERVSVSSEGQQAAADSNSQAESAGLSTFVDVSDDGRFVVFDSAAPNLVPQDEDTPPFVLDVFVRDRLAGTTTMVSVSTSGRELEGLWHTAAISGDGRVITFHGRGRSLLAPDDEGGSRPPYPVEDDLTLYAHVLPEPR